MAACDFGNGQRGGSLRAILTLCVAAACAPWVASRSPAQEPSGLAVVAGVEQAVVDCIERAEPSVVSIARYRDNLSTTSFPFDNRAAPSFENRVESQVPNEFGTGVIIDARGLVLTNYHVLGEQSTYGVTTVERRTYEARIKAADPRSDLAVLELVVPDRATRFEPIALGDASKLRKGQFVVALGNPYTIARDGEASASWGIVANLARKAAPSLSPIGTPDEAHQTIHQFGTLIQTDAKLNLGTSGGPLLNLQGEMVGLVTSEAAISGFEEAAGYAIPVDNMFRWVVERLKEGREAEYGFLGVSPSPESPPVPADRPIRGTQLTSVVPGTPAYRAGLKENDIIVAINGEPIDGRDELMLHVGRLAAESRVRLEVERDGERREIVAELAKYPVTGQKIVTQPAASWRDIRVDFVTTLDQLAQRFPLGLPESGVLVAEVPEGSRAWDAGLRPQMIVTHVGTTPIISPSEFFAAVKGRSGTVRLRVWGSGEEQTEFDVPPDDRAP